MVSELGVAAATVVVTILIHWFSSSDSEQERQETLRSSLVGEGYSWTESEKGNEFCLTITDLRVEESERLLYRMITKPLPIVGGFAGETAVFVNIDGTVLLEEWVLIKHLASSPNLRNMVADFQLNGDELVFVLNTADEDEIRKQFTGVVRAIEVHDQYLAESTVSQSDRKTLGQLVGGGVARPIFVDVAFPTRPIHQVLALGLKALIKYSVGSMNRSFVWVRQTPMRRTSNTKFRVRYPNQKPERKIVTPLDWLYIFSKSERCSEGGVELMRILHMGYRVHRDFAESGEVVVKNGSRCLAVSIANLQDKTDVYDTRPTSDHLVTGIQMLNDRWYLPSDVEEPTRTGIEIPIDNFDPRLFDEIDSTNLSTESRNKLISLLPPDGATSTAITGLGNGIVQAYYRGGDGSWYFTVRWGDNGEAVIDEIGEARPDSPIKTEGYVIWQRHHPGSRTVYAPIAQHELEEN